MNTNFKKDFPKPLTKEEEQKTIALLNTDKAAEAREKLIVHNLRLVVFVVEKLNYTGLPKEDLISLGTIGLIKAVNTFNPSKGFKFSTYAPICIKNEVLMFLRKSIRHKDEISLDELIYSENEDKGMSLLDLLGDVDTRLELVVELSGLKTALEKLSEQEYQVIDLRYGLTTRSPLSQKEAAKIMGITQSYFSRLEQKALSKLRREMFLSDYKCH